MVYLKCDKCGQRKRDAHTVPGTDRVLCDACWFATRPGEEETPKGEDRCEGK